MRMFKRGLRRADMPLNKRAGFLYPLRPFRRGAKEDQAKHQAPRGTWASLATKLPCHNSVTHVQESGCTIGAHNEKCMHVTG